ncbi:hypothetical protein E2C01_012311 [Portunus trituberculatus]|uniref:Uncharacterized protein n=1 Tax=Portunus trituberculatus TaxID=210409 RepID=A0A5B7DDL8_PORTR|nr:hypothetical protein [Portunus trituberculatus]
MQMLTEQMSRLTQEVDGLKTQMQHHRDEQGTVTARWWWVVYSAVIETRKRVCPRFSKGACKHGLHRLKES